MTRLEQKRLEFYGVRFKQIITYCRNFSKLTRIRVNLIKKWLAIPERPAILLHDKFTTFI